MQNPIAVIVDKALAHITSKDPSWDSAQPADFKVRVVESWKDHITNELRMNTRVLWQLTIGENTFGCMAPIFCLVDWHYNPYLLGMHEPHLLKKIQ